MQIFAKICKDGANVRFYLKERLQRWPRAHWGYKYYIPAVCPGPSLQIFDEDIVSLRLFLLHLCYVFANLSCIRKNKASKKLKIPSKCFWRFYTFLYYFYLKTCWLWFKHYLWMISWRIIQFSLKETLFLLVFGSMLLHINASFTIYVKKLGFRIWDKNGFYSFFSPLFENFLVWNNRKSLIFPQGNAKLTSSSFFIYNREVLRCIVAHGVVWIVY